MAKKTKTREITITGDKGAFSVLWKKFSKEEKFDFEGISALRRILSNERAKMLHIIKSKNPKSIYELSRFLERDFKSVSDDIKLLDQFGFIDLLSEKTGKRTRLKPVVIVDSIRIDIFL